MIFPENSKEVRRFILGFKGEILILVKMKLPFRILRAPPPKKTKRKFCTLDLARMSHFSNKSLREFSLTRVSEIFSDFLLEKIRIFLKRFLPGIVFFLRFQYGVIKEKHAFSANENFHGDCQSPPAEKDDEKILHPRLRPYASFFEQKS